MRVRGASSRRRTGIVLACAAVSAAALLTGCTTTGIGSSGPKTDKVGLSGARLSDPFQVVLLDNLAEQAGEQKVDMLPATNADEDAAKQVTDIVTLLSQNVGGVITIPVDSDAIVPAIQQADKRGVPVVTVDVAPNGGKAYMVVRADNVLMAREACEEMGKRLNGKGTVLELQGALGSANGRDRTEGFNQCMTTTFPGIKVVSKPTDWDSQKATDAAQSVLSSQQIDGIYEASDTVMQAGVTKVLQQQGKYVKAGQPGHVVTISIDGGTEALAQIRDGYQDALVPQPVDLYSRYAIKYIGDALAGKAQAAGPTDHGSQIVVDAHGNLADMLPASIVTAANASDPALWGNKS
ncbi:sugar ABC transporter substrate-binding protein [Amycolatopsis acidicola]|nr:sugar ABC transporter substrate-binding protein [Amycolatopsis acidicola]